MADRRVYGWIQGILRVGYNYSYPQYWCTEVIMFVSNAAFILETDLWKSVGCAVFWL